MRTYSDDWLIELSDGVVSHWIAGQHFDLNSQANSVIATDKAASSALLSARGIPHVPHYLLDRKEQERLELPSIKRALGQYEVVMKPLKGHSGRLVTKIQSIDQAKELLINNPGYTWAYGPLRNLESEVRLVVLDGTIELALKKINPTDHDGLKLFNLSRGATAKIIDTNHIDAGMAKMATTAMHALGLKMAAVDVIMTTQGEVEILEINAIFSLMRFAKINDATYEEVASFYDRLIVKLFTS